jgi:hypothetical protein
MCCSKLNGKTSFHSLKGVACKIFHTDAQPGDQDRELESIR